jgi:hypothetical protein
MLNYDPVDKDLFEPSIIDVYREKRLELSEPDLKAFVAALTPKDRVLLEAFFADKEPPELEYWEIESRYRQIEQWRERFQKQRPEWFTEESKNDTTDEFFDDPPVDEERADNQSIIIEARFAEVRNAIKKLTRWPTFQFWLLVVLLAVFLLR